MKTERCRSLYFLTGNIPSQLSSGGVGAILNITPVNVVCRLTDPAAPPRTMPSRKTLAPQYRDNAAECLLRAADATDPAVKASFQELARQWTKLAEHRERIDSRQKRNDKL
jgi:hypothetical protein